MKVRDVVIFNGQKFTVPQCIQRIDQESTHGWQVRYQGTKLFSDGTPDGSGAARSLQRAPSAHKTSDLPAGISGPIVRARADSKVRSATFSVLIPRFGESPRITSIYIGNENTYTPERYREALDKALALRAQAEKRYEAAATRARRKAGRELRAVLLAAQRKG
jgi:hypothetical protein